MSNESVGSLLAVIANSLNDALRILMFADKRAWKADEFEQLRLLEETLDEAKKDFQELPALVNGRFYYEHDRKSESLHELRELCARFALHAQNFKDWLRHGGPINPVWAIETMTLRRELHRAQCRAARRVYDAEQAETPARCLGALQVYRIQQKSRLRSRPRPPPEGQQQGAAATAVHQHQHQHRHRQQHHHSRNQNQNSNPTPTPTPTPTPDPNSNLPPPHLEELAACNQTGKFERFGESDIAFVCDFCDGYLVWEDLREMPSIRAGTLPPGGNGREPLSITTTTTFSSTSNKNSRPMRRMGAVRAATNNHHSHSHGGGSNSNNNNNTAATATATATANGTSLSPPPPSSGPPEAEAEAEEATPPPDQWQAAGFARSDGAEKTIVFAPVAIANHLAPAETLPGEWQARILCPFCDEYYYEATGDDEVERTRYAQDEAGFATVREFQDHCEWYHTSVAMSLPGAAAKCGVM